MALTTKTQSKCITALRLRPWLTTTADLQIVNPGLKRSLSSSMQLAGVDTAVVAGIRLRVRF
jgi:hypothetical protein